MLHVFDTVTIMYILWYIFFTLSPTLYSMLQVFDTVTIMFTYLLGFAELCSEVSPMRIVHCINTIFSYFDTIVDKYDVFKVCGLNVHTLQLFIIFGPTYNPKSFSSTLLLAQHNIFIICPVYTLNLNLFI